MGVIGYRSDAKGVYKTTPDSDGVNGVTCDFHSAVFQHILHPISCLFNVRLLTAKFPYRAEIFDDEATISVLDRLSLMHHIQAETVQKNGISSRRFRDSLVQAGDNWVGSPKMKAGMLHMSHNEDG